MSTSELKQWLDSPCEESHIKSLPWDKTISYVPIEYIRLKMKIMEDQFGAFISQFMCNVNAVNMNNKDKDVCFMATVGFEITHPDLGGIKKICGAASIFTGQYDGGWAFAQIAESIATTRAFGKEWRQFGYGLNAEDGIHEMKKPVVTLTKSQGAIASTVKDILKS